VTFKVGDKVRYQPDPNYWLAYHDKIGKEARVSQVAEEGSKAYPIMVRFSYNPIEFPVKAEELVLIEKEEGNK
jgi:hypothetical protein